MIARNRLRARLKCPWSYVREEREIFDFGIFGDMETLNGIDVDFRLHRKAEIHTRCRTRYK